VLEDAMILIHEKKITALRDLLPLLETVAREGKPLLIIAEAAGRAKNVQGKVKGAQGQAQGVA